MISKHGGHIIDTAGDGVLAEFGSAINAVECALAIQTTMVERNTNVDPERRIFFRIGVNLGNVIHDEVRVYCNGVNIAAPLEPYPTLEGPASREWPSAMCGESLRRA